METPQKKFEFIFSKKFEIEFFSYLEISLTCYILLLLLNYQMQFMKVVNIPFFDLPFISKEENECFVALYAIIYSTQFAS